MKSLFTASDRSDDCAREAEGGNVSCGVARVVSCFHDCSAPAGEHVAEHPFCVSVVQQSTSTIGGGSISGRPPQRSGAICCEFYKCH